MNKYEVLYIISPKATDEVKENIVKRFETLVVDNGGEVEKTDKWGLKKLAFEVDKHTEGYYVLMNFAAKAEFPLELERQMRNTEEIIRLMVVRKDN